MNTKNTGQEFKNKSIVHDTNSINPKQTCKENNNMASKKFSAVNSIDIHVNKLVPENDTLESNNNVVLPFPYEEEDLPTQVQQKLLQQLTAEIMRIQKTKL